MSLLIHPDKHLDQVELANASFHLLKQCFQYLKQSLPPALIALESFKELSSDMSSTGKASIASLLMRLGPLSTDPICSTLLKRAYLIALSTGYYMIFYDHAMSGELADLFIEILSNILANGECIDEEEQSINERLVHFSEEAKEVRNRAQCDTFSAGEPLSSLIPRTCNAGY
jgi:hypothetical protein